MRFSRGFLKILNCRHYTQDLRKTAQIFTLKLDLPDVDYNVDYLCNPANRDVIHDNITKRKSDGNIDKVHELFQQPELRNSFLLELNKIPNTTHPSVLEYGEQPKIIKTCGTRPTFTFKPRELINISQKLKIMKKGKLGLVAGQRAYALIGGLAELEQALINFAVSKLIAHKFNLISVPDILPTEIIKRCGLISKEDRVLVYQLEHEYGEDLSLSGTAEMALAYKIMNTTFSHEELPLKLAAVSRCYRAETSRTAKEKGIFRVHQFTKVEMFSCCDQESSSNIFQEIIDIQENMFNELELYFNVLDMPPSELGAQAFRKVDIEGWMPGHQLFGELTSCSNCTDYQSRRLNIKYKTKDEKLLYVHTLNGTACAIPRMLIATVEKYQLKNGDIAVPKILVPFMNGKTVITGDGMPEFKTHSFNLRNKSSVEC